MAPTPPLTVRHRVRRLVLGFYASEEHAQEAFREIHKGHFRQSAVVQRAADGRFVVLSAGSAPYIRAALAIVSASALAFFGALAGVDGRFQVLLALSALLAVWLGAPWWGLGFPRRLLRRHGR